MDTWCRETKRTQTKPILTDLPLPAEQRTSLTSFSRTTYATTPQSQKRTQTNPISPPGANKLLDELKHKHKKYRAGTRDAADTLTSYISTNQGPMRYHAFGTTGYDTASGAGERPCNNMGSERLKNPAIIPSSPASSAALPPRPSRLNNNSDKTCLQNHRPHEKSTYNREVHPIARHLQNMC
jgi:hypothetical protein